MCRRRVVRLLRNGGGGEGRAPEPTRNLEGGRRNTQLGNRKVLEAQPTPRVPAVFSSRTRAFIARSSDIHMRDWLELLVAPSQMHFSSVPPERLRCPSICKSCRSSPSRLQEGRSPGPGAMSHKRAREDSMRSSLPMWAGNCSCGSTCTRARLEARGEADQRGGVSAIAVAVAASLSYASGVIVA